MSYSILNISKRLVDELNANSISYCHWKNNHCLERSLAGEDDLDLLVKETDYDRFRSVVAALGFKEAANEHIKFPCIFHFYGLDAAAGKLVHLHVHTRLVTGESHIKNYFLPLERMVLQNTRSHASGCRVPQPEVELILFVLRYYIKISCLPGAVLVRKRKDYLSAEFSHVQRDVKSCRVDFLLETHFKYVSIGFLDLLIAALRKRTRLFVRVLLGLELRWRIKSLRRLSALQAMRARYSQLIYRALNKVVLREKKSLVSGGAIIATTGLDASGKSTVNYELQEWLKSDLNVRHYHVGRPRPCVETLLFRALLNTKKLFDSSSGEDTPSNHNKRGILFALRYLVLAYERSRLLKSADKFRTKGYVVICDRYPSLTLGVMDSPRIGQVQGSQWYNLMGRVERRLYDAIPLPDAIYNLSIPFELALGRNHARVKADKETDFELRERYRRNANLQYRARSYEVIDASRDFPIVLAEMKEKIWERL